MRTLSRLVFAGAVAATVGLSHAQEFQRVIGTPNADTGMDVKYVPGVAGTTLAPGFAVVGYSEIQPAGSGAGRQIILSRHAMDGTQVWGENIAMVNGPEQVGYTVTPLLDGGFAVGFETSSLSPFGIGVLKVNPFGAPIWTSMFTGTPFVDYPAGVSVRTAMNGDILAVGRYTSPASGLTQGVILRIAAATGAPIWAWTYPYVGTPTSGVSFTDIAELPDGTLVVSGTVKAKATPNATTALWAHFTAGGAPILWELFSVSGFDTKGDGIDASALSSLSVLSGRIRPTGISTPFDTTMVWEVTPVGGLVSAFTYKGFVDGFQAVKFVPYTDPSGTVDNIIVSGSASSTLFPDGEAAMLYLPKPLLPINWSMHYGSPVFDSGNGAVAFPDTTGALSGFTLAGATDDPIFIPRDEYFLKTNFAGNTFCDEGPLPITPGTVPLKVSTTQSTPGTISYTQYQVETSPVTTLYICPNCPPCVGDLNGDGVVDDADFVIFANCYNEFIVTSAVCYCADLNHDGFVDDADFVIFAAAYDNYVCPPPG
jgi:hypothetical protein